uniref:J domain-containing protein n=1 Tax=Amorphochlora amoebiformis TaxID=1561963 RepID=A0A7S0H8W5_9EUKA
MEDDREAEGLGGHEWEEIEELDEDRITEILKGMNLLSGEDDLLSEGEVVGDSSSDENDENITEFLRSIRSRMLDDDQDLRSPSRRHTMDSKGYYPRERSPQHFETCRSKSLPNLENIENLRDSNDLYDLDYNLHGLESSHGVSPKNSYPSIRQPSNIESKKRFGRTKIDGLDQGLGNRFTFDTIGANGVEEGEWMCVLCREPNEGQDSECRLCGEPNPSSIPTNSKLQTKTRLKPTLSPHRNAEFAKKQAWIDPESPRTFKASKTSKTSGSAPGQPSPSPSPHRAPLRPLKRVKNLRPCRTVVVRDTKAQREASDPSEEGKSNENPLGKLQVGGGNGKDNIRANHRCPYVREDPNRTKSAGATILPISKWVEGDISGEMAVSEVLDHLFVNVSKSATNLALATQMYSSKGDAVGGVLGTLAGGIPLNTSKIALWLYSSIFSRDPKEVTREAVEWLCESLGVFESGVQGEGEGEGVRGQSLPMSHLLGRLMEVPASMINLAFSRSCLQAHPHRQKGSLQDYLTRHIYLELVRKCWARLPTSANSTREDINNLLFGRQDPDDSEDPVEDKEVLHELTANPKSIFKESKSLKPEELETLNGKIDDYIEFLIAYKDRADEELKKLQATSYYAVLGAHPDMTDAELTRCYRKAILKTHPDKPGGSKERFQAVRLAFKTLTTERQGKQSDITPPQTQPQPTSPTTHADPSFYQNSKQNPEDPNSSTNANPYPAKPNSNIPNPNPSPNPPAEGETKVKTSKGTAKDDKQLERAEKDAEHETIPNADKKLPEADEKLLKADEGLPEADEELPKAEEKFPQESPETSEEPRGKTKQNSKPSRTEEKESFEKKKAMGTNEKEGVPRKVLETEHISLHAEMAAHGAQMCIKVAKAATAALEGSSEHAFLWEPVVKCAIHVVEMADHVVSSTQMVGTSAIAASDSPTEVVKLVTGSSIKSKKLANEALKVLQLSMTTSDKGKIAASRAAECANTMEKLSREVSQLKIDPSGTRTMTDLVNTVADCAKRAANSAIDAATLTGLLRDQTESLVLMFKRANEAAEQEARQKQQEEENEDEAKVQEQEKEESGGKQGKDGKGSAEGGDEGKGGDKKAEKLSEGDEQAGVSHRLRNKTRLNQLNSEILEIQNKIKIIVTSRPQTIPEVSLIQKNRLFGLVAEFVARVMGSVSQAWLDARMDQSKAPKWVETVIEILDFFQEGISPELAVPRSIQSRLIRQAALVDVDALVNIIGNQFQTHVMTFKPKVISEEEEKSLAAKFKATITHLRAIPSTA